MKFFVFVATIAVSIFGSVDIANAQTRAGPATRAFSDCMLKNTTSEDNINLIRWMFTISANHPDVKDLTNITPEAIKKSNKNMGAYFNRLIIEKCPSEARAAYRENPNAMFDAFNVVGQKVGRELVGHEMVASQMTGFISEIDTVGVQKVFQEK